MSLFILFYIIVLFLFEATVFCLEGTGFFRDRGGVDECKKILLNEKEVLNRTSLFFFFFFFFQENKRGVGGWESQG